MGRTILKLYQPTAGQIFFEGKNIADYKPKEMRGLRTKMQIVFQDPYSSLPPRSTVGDILSEPVRVHHIVPPSQVKEYVLKVMEQCGLRDYYYERYPHEFSGGQRQRICIARALVVGTHVGRVRRACFGPRRFYSGADYQSVEEIADGKAAHIPFHFA